MKETPFVLAFLALVLGATAPALQAPPKPPPDPWLKGTPDEKFRQVENHLRGFDLAMVEVGYRYTELYFAGLDRNWAYAKYQAEKMEQATRLALERRPKRTASARPFLEEDLPVMLRAVDKQDPSAFREGFERLRAGCMKCHVAEKLEFFTVEVPEHRASPVRTAR